MTIRHPEWLGLRWSRLKCRLLDRHDLYCRGRMDHISDLIHLDRKAAS